MSTWRVRSLVFLGPLVFTVLTMVRHRPPVVGCVDEDAAHRVWRTPSTLPSTHERCLFAALSATPPREV